MNVKFSILMANYNNGRFISQAIESVQRQIFKDWELVIVDDASTDDSLAVISCYLDDGRIRLFRNVKNEGCGAAKRKCADEARGDIYCEFDPDDVLAEDALNEVKEYYEINPQIEVVCTNHYVCDESLRIRSINAWAREYDPRLTNLIEPMSTALRTFKSGAYRRTSGYDPSMKRAVDKDIIYKLEETSRVGYLNKPLYYYRRHKKGISTGINAWRARLWDNLAQYSAYQRRIGTEIPNLSNNHTRDVLCDGFWRSMFLRDKEKMEYFFRESRKMGGGYTQVFMFPFRYIKKKFIHPNEAGNIHSDGQ